MRVSKRSLRFSYPVSEIVLAQIHALELTQLHTHPGLFAVREAQPAIRLVAIPKSHSLPDPIFELSFLRGENLHTLTWQLTRPVEGDAGINSRNNELSRAELSG
jgi:hypothetical protein